MQCKRTAVPANKLDEMATRAARQAELEEIVRQVREQALALRGRVSGWEQPDLRLAHSTDSPKESSSRRAKLRLV